MQIKSTEIIVISSNKLAKKTMEKKSMAHCFAVLGAGGREEAGEMEGWGGGVIVDGGGGR